MGIFFDNTLTIHVELFPLGSEIPFVLKPCRIHDEKTDTASEKMFRIDHFFFTCVLLQLTFSNVCRFASTQATSSGQTMEALGVVPDVIDVAPAGSITVTILWHMIKACHQ